MKLKNTLIGQLTCLLLFAVSACSSPSENKPAKEVPAYKTVTVEIKQMKFVPDSVTVSQGDHVLFVNNDMVAHDVTEEGSGAWSSSPLKPDAYWMLVATISQNYYCSLHTVMKGKIIVR